MLSFVDQNTNIKVFRIGQDAEGTISRTRVGIIRKKDFLLDSELEKLEGLDRQKIEDAISFYKKNEQASANYALYSFPDTVRRVVELCVAGKLTETENDIVMAALLEGLRLMRKTAKDAVEPPAT